MHIQKHKILICFQYDTCIIALRGICYFIADVTTTQFWLQNANAEQMNGRHGNKRTQTHVPPRNHPAFGLRLDKLNSIIHVSGAAVL